MSFLTGEVKQSWNRAQLHRDQDSYRSLAPSDKHAARMPLVYGNDDFVLTPAACWVGLAVPNKPWGFHDDKTRRQYFYSARSVYERLFPTGKENSGHLKVVNRTYTADDWMRNLLARNPHGMKALGAYVAESASVIAQHEFSDREVYLFVRAGARGNKSGWRGTVGRSLDAVFGAPSGDDERPSDDELSFWTGEAQKVRDILGNSYLGADPLSRRQMEWIVRDTDTPGLPTPDHVAADGVPWEAGDWRTTLASYTRRVPLGTDGNRRVDGMMLDAPVGEGVGYVAFLPVTHIPQAVRFDTNWLHHSSTLPFPVNVDVRFEVIDPDRAERDLEKPITAAETQEEEDREAGIRPDDIVAAQREGLAQVRHQVRQARKPICYWQAVFSVYASTPADLMSKVTQLIRHYKDIDFTLECPPLDQRSFLYQSFPGSDMLTTDWVHVSDLEFFAAAQPWLTTNVGDRLPNLGLYQGYTRVQAPNGELRKGVPVFTDLQNVVDEEGKAPTEAVAAEPGSGKRLSLDTVLPSMRGMVTVGDVEVGDRLFDEAGRPCTVTHLHPVEHNPDAYRVRFSDGTTVLADAEHRWTTHRRDGATLPDDAPEWVPVLAGLLSSMDPTDTTTPVVLRAQLVAAVNAHGPQTGPFLRQTAPPLRVFEKAARALPATSMPDLGGLSYSAPALAEAVLAAGGVTSPWLLPRTLTTATILSTLAGEDGLPAHAIPVAGAAQYPTRLLPLPPYQVGQWLGGATDTKTGTLTATEMGAYFTAGMDQRLALLHGLMDRCGTVDGPTCHATPRDGWAEQVASLVASLGMITTRDGQSVVFTANQKVGRDQRLLERLVLPTDSSPPERRFIVAVEKVAPVPMRCITVDSASSLYLCTAQYVPTHNTVSRGSYVALQNAYRGVTQFIWDPKGDFLPLWTKAAQLRLDPAKVKLVDLYNPAVSVSLDSYAIADVDPERGVDERATSAQAVLEWLCHTYVTSKDSGQRAQLLLQQAIKHTMEHAEKNGTAPTMKFTLETLRLWMNDGTEGVSPQVKKLLTGPLKHSYKEMLIMLHEHLEMVSKTTLGSLLFRDPHGAGTMKVERGDMVIFVAINMKTTEPGETPTVDTRIGDVISGLMADYIRSLLYVLPDYYPKSAMFDEWHVIKRTGRADALVGWMRRMGRSKRCTVTQMSQSATDFDKRSLSTVWAGWVSNDEAATASCELLGIEDSDTNRSVLKSLGKGEFLFRDHYGRVARVQVDLWSKELLNILATEANKKEVAAVATRGAVSPAPVPATTGRA